MKTLLVDGQWNLKRNFYKRKSYTAKGELCGGSFGFIDSLKKAVERIYPDRVIVMWDGLNSGKLRYDIYKPYKSKRKSYWKEEIELLETNGGTSNEQMEKFELLKQKLVVNEFLDEFCIRHLEVNKIEADDLIGYYILKSNIDNEHIVIFSRDGDYLQLIDDNVSVLTPDSFEVITVENFKKHFGYYHENALLIKCFEGDKSDEISGVNGVTKDKLIELFPELTIRKYKYDSIVEECYEKKTKKKLKVYDKIIGAREILYRNAKLMNLKSPFMNQEAIEKMEKIIKWEMSDDRNIKNAIKLFMHYGFNKFVPNQFVDLFFAPFFVIINKEKEYKLKFKKNE